MKNVTDIYPLSPVQLGMLFHTLANAQAGVYVNQYTCQLHGSLQPELWRQAWQKTVARHPVLRTAFLWEELEEPLQIVRQEVDLPWQELDWRDLSEAEQTTQLEAFLQRDRAQGFDLAQAPVLRLTLIQLRGSTVTASDRPLNPPILGDPTLTSPQDWEAGAANIYQLIWSSHHLLFDGWSLPLIWQDMLAYYAARQQGTQPQLTPIRPYRDYIAWHQSQDFTAAEAFWRSQLQSFTEPTPLPAARTGISTSNALYRQSAKTLPSSLTDQLKALARQHRLTLNTLIQGAWALLLSHYSSKDEVIYGAVVSGRPAELNGVENMVGLFINTLPVHVAVDPNQSLIPWLQARHQQQLDLRRYEATPLTDIQRWSDIPAGNSLFESIVVFENYPTVSAPNLGFETMNARYLEQSNYPLALLVVPGESLELLLLFDPARFEAEAIARLLDHLELLLTAFVEQPQRTLADLPRLTAAEQQQLANWEQTDYPQNCTIHQLIEAQVQKTPDAEAVVFEGQALTYAELNQRADQLAAMLRSRGVGQGDRVALCLHPSLDRIISILAVLKAGAAYVPLDPAYPAARLTYCLQDTEPRLVVTQRSVELPDTDVRCLYLDGMEEALQGTQETRETRHVASLQGDGATTPSSHLPISPSPHLTSDNLAYIIYTSGSTGQPKGVMVSHRNLVHSTTARSHVYPDPVGRFLLLSSIAFDSSVAGIFWTLCQGGTLILPPERIEQDLQQLVTLIAEQRITHTLCVPTLYALLLNAADPQQLATLHTVIVAGEACPRTLAQQHHAKLPNTLLYNEYGPTEATVWATAYRIPYSLREGSANDPAQGQPSELPPGPIAIGHPIPNTQIYLLNQHLQPVPTGAIGELYIAGDGVSQGYWQQPEKTAAAFVEWQGSQVAGWKSKSVQEPGTGNRLRRERSADIRHVKTRPVASSPLRLYKTGDLARYRANGTLEWLGRCDRQVKIRGYRIELGEIEDALRSQVDVQEAVVIAPALAPSAATVESLVAALASLDAATAEALLTSVEGGQ